MAATAHDVERTSKDQGDDEGDSQLAIQRLHLDWSHKQSRILTADGTATECYRRFPFQKEELPHYHLLAGQDRSAFSKWSSDQADTKPLVCGAWTRTLFYGGWEYSTSSDEITYNLQTPTLFIDLRIPKTRHRVLPSSASSLRDYDDFSLRLYARQHVFAGYTRLCWEKNKPVCTRFHCIDWNFVGVPRPLPNKWWVEMAEDKQKWKEWAYATNEDGQYYYCEHWQRLEGGEGNEVSLAIRKKPSTADEPDGVLVVVGDHFSYVIGRQMNGGEKSYPSAGSLVDLVDMALAAGDRATAESLLTIDAGHGIVSKGWLIDCSVQPWKEGTRLSGISLAGGDTIKDCCVVWMGCEWEISSCSVSTTSDLEKLFCQL